jgi:Rrf2 family protein
MIKISKKADYAVLIMASLATRAGFRQADDAGRPGSQATVCSHEIADENNLSRPLCANLLKALARAGLLCSVRGAGGGYYLAHPANDITLAQILHAVDGPTRFVECAPGDDPAFEHNCSAFDHCPSRGAMRAVHLRVARLMQEIRLPELLNFEQRLDAAPKHGRRAELPTVPASIQPRP